MADENTILLDEVQQELAQRAIRDLSYGLTTLSLSLRNTQSVNAELALNILRCTDHNLAALGTVLGIATQTGQEIEERSAGLRAANERIRSLERQLGYSLAPAATQASLKQMCERMNTWWSLEGFGHISHIRFGEFGCEVFFSCHLFGGFSSPYSSTPISDKKRKKEWFERIIQSGYQLTTAEHEDTSLLDSDHTGDSGAPSVPELEYAS